MGQRPSHAAMPAVVPGKYDSTPTPSESATAALQMQHQMLVQQWGAYLESRLDDKVDVIERRMSDFEKSIERRLDSAVEKLTNDAKNTEIRITNVLSESNRTIRAALDKGDETFERIADELREQRGVISGIRQKIDKVDRDIAEVDDRTMMPDGRTVADTLSGMHAAVEKRRSSTSEIVRHKTGIMEKYVLPNLATVVITSAMALASGMVTFYMKAQVAEEFKAKQDAEHAQTVMLKELTDALRGMKSP